MITTAGGSFHGNLSSGSGGYLSRGGEGTRAIDGEPVGVFGTGRRPFEARYARIRGEGANAAETDDCGVEGLKACEEKFWQVRSGSRG